MALKLRDSKQFRFLTKISVLTKIPIFDRSFDCWQNFRFLTKNSVLTNNFGFAKNCEKQNFYHVFNFVFLMFFFNLNPSFGHTLDIFQSDQICKKLRVKKSCVDTLEWIIQKNDSPKLLFFAQILQTKKVAILSQISYNFHTFF